MKKNFTTALLLCLWASLRGQTPLLTDGMMAGKDHLANGAFYGDDRWKNYWEGTLKRDNQNIGTLSTQSVTWMGVYGLNDKVTVIGMLPYIWTHASGGTLHGLSGLQDLTIAAKYNFYTKEFGSSAIKFFALVSYTTPVGNYTPDFLPMSIGLGSKNLSGRLTGTYAINGKWLITASGAYTYRSNIHLDRSSYYNNGQLYNTNEVQMYDVFDYIIRAGYHHPRWHAELFYTQQNTLGGGDMGRQDMPFPAFKMNTSKVGISLWAEVPHVKNLTFRLWSNYTVDGRNVGQSTTITTGLMYRLNLSKPQI